MNYDKVADTEYVISLCGDHRAVVLSFPYLARRWVVLERRSAWLVVNTSKGMFQRNPQP